ncbi:hypothetical protein [Marinobacter sp. SS8-8]|uniref:hypothetical protein n=1 Tax=Marinobacter sp. SS8-8 TaxID=3050452 RepID=UPI0026DF8652|nr:hypothetical protein [Marinobacter sp. SS8-8]
MTARRYRYRKPQTVEELLQEERRPGREFSPGVYLDFREKYDPLKLYNSQWLRITVGKMNAARSYSEDENRKAWQMMRDDLEKAYTGESVESMREMVRKQQEEFRKLKEGK